MAVLAGRHHMRIGITSNGRIRLLTKDTELNLSQGKSGTSGASVSEHSYRTLSIGYGGLFVCVFGRWIVWSRDFFRYGPGQRFNLFALRPHLSDDSRLFAPVFVELVY
jgi:hypothetical protein